MRPESTRGDREVLLQIVTENGGSMGNAALREALSGWLGRAQGEHPSEQP